MNRKTGIGAIHKQKLAQAKYKDKGTELAEDRLVQLSKQLEVFRDRLQDFAGKYKNEIKKNGQFRRQFQEMCATIGVDPLASSKGFWSEMLGVGDFYYELGVQIIEVCLATSHRSGGLMDLNELRERLINSRGKKNSQDITNDDLLRAIKKLKVLGSGFKVIQLGGRHLVQSVPMELSMDHTAVVQLAEGTGYVSVELAKENLKWQEDRVKRTLYFLVQHGLVWVDEQGGRQGTLYWFPALVSYSGVS